ncbi:hypothetical protein CC56_2506 [Bordetella pertussis H934]|nr:hypothetical protein CC56_2506 [Bordetella pertussis H934]
MSEPRPRRILPIIVLAQFCGTSLWFAGNAASADLGMGDSVAYVASAVQLGFIVGTLCSAWLRIADRYAASRLFFGSCLLGAACNYPLTMLALASSSAPVAAVRRRVPGAGRQRPARRPRAVRTASARAKRSTRKAKGEA